MGKNDVCNYILICNNVFVTTAMYQYFDVPINEKWEHIVLMLISNQRKWIISALVRCVIINGFHFIQTAHIHTGFWYVT